MNADRAAVHFDQRADKGQSNAQTDVPLLQRAVDLSEHFKHPPLHRLGDADPVVADGDNRLAGLLSDRQFNLPPAGRVLDRIVEQI